MSLNIVRWYPRNRWWWLIVTVSVLLSWGLASLGILESVRTNAYLGLVLLMLALLPANLIKLPVVTNTALRPYLVHLVPYRRSFGISAGIMFVLHALAALRLYNGQLWPPLPFITTREIILGASALVVFLLMLSTSSQYSITILKQWWKRLHSLVWLIVPFGLFHSLMASDRYLARWSRPALLGFGLLFGFVMYEYFSARHAQRVDLQSRRHIRYAVIGLLIGLFVWRVWP